MLSLSQSLPLCLFQFICCHFAGENLPFWVKEDFDVALNELVSHEKKKK